MLLPLHRSQWHRRSSLPIHGLFGVVVAILGACGIDSRSERLQRDINYNVWSSGSLATVSVGHRLNVRKSFKATLEYCGSSESAVNPRRDHEAGDHQ